ncbi:MAG: helix-turn-helix transcriptional regulator [Clostridia bacterium]|nr:helix-turn-helix transcriptional regulator [Clostridia bacterium]
MELGNNIRSLRKQRGMTQEQLAQAMGVTVGAVYKWEAEKCVPDISIIMELADLFGVSIDVLLSYHLRENSRKDLVQRLKCFRREKSGDTVLCEAEKALMRYPNSFDIVYESAELYAAFGVERHDKQQIRRAMELYEYACRLIDQNTNAEISELSICVNIAYMATALGESERALAILREKNPCRMNHAAIGYMLASDLNRPQEAGEYLSMALLDQIVTQFQIVMGYVNMYVKTKRYREAAEILNWQIASYQGLKKPGEASFLHKNEALFEAVCALMWIKQGEPGAARDHLRRAKAAALQFDTAPDYHGKKVRFFENTDEMTIYDDMGATAMEAIEKYIAQEKCGEMSAMWEEVKKEA